MAGDLTLQARTQQNTYKAIQKDNVATYARCNRRGELIVPDFFTQLAFEGRVYVAGNAARETAETIGDATFLDTQPSLLLDIPANTVGVVLEVVLDQGGTEATGILTTLMTVDTKVRRTSGDTATIRNYRINGTQPNTSVATVTVHDEGTTNSVVTANGTDISIFSALHPFDENGLAGSDFRWNARDYTPVVLHGPASLAVYSFGTGQPDYFWHIIWAEIPSTSFV